MNSSLDVQRLLRDHDPVPRVDRSRPLDRQASAMLERILLDEPPATTTERGPVRRLVPRLAAVGALTLAVAAGGVVLTGREGGGAYAATPKPLVTRHEPVRAGAVDGLRRLATRAAQAPSEVGSGSGVTMTYRTWSLFTRIDGVDVRSQVVPQQISTQVDAEGKGTRAESYTMDGDTTRSRTTIDDGPVPRLSGDVEELTRQLAKRNPSSAAGRFNAVVESHLESPTTPAVRAAVLRYVAQTPTVRTVGRVEDRAGRPGVGYTVSSDASGLPTDYTLVFDSETGALLDYEEMLTRSAGKLDVPVPSVIEYIVWQRSVYSD